jgi:phenylacetate-coenzyme A ligase PaaK-like adenylate-forming protein
MESPIVNRLRHVLRIHFDADLGTPYWLERQRELGIRATEEIQNIEGLALLGSMDERALAERPIEDFVPRAFRRCNDYLIAETAGTLGKPKTAVHRADEFEAAFIVPFLKAVRRTGFPEGGHWLFVGPTGPHIIGRAARRCARALGAGDAFTVDFDPRWAKKLTAGSFAAQRSLNHIEEQALHILEVQNIGVLFATPAVLTGLAEKVAESKRLAIRGIHLGGMHASAEFMDRIGEKLPNAVVLSGYGNTLFGMIPQLGCRRETGFDYYPHGDRLVVTLVPLCEDGGRPDLMARAEYGERGQVMVHRLDEMQLLVNVLERDTAVRIEAPGGDAAADGFPQDGLRDPRPIVSEAIKLVKDCIDG